MHSPLCAFLSSAHSLLSLSPSHSLSPSLFLSAVLEWLERDPRLLDDLPPFIAFPTVDENWGFLSTHFLNRTTGKDVYAMTYQQHTLSTRYASPRHNSHMTCDTRCRAPSCVLSGLGYHMTLALHKPPDRIPRDGQLREVRAFLDHPKLLLLVTNQHHNVSHPKVGPTTTTHARTLKTMSPFRPPLAAHASNLSGPPRLPPA